MAGLRQEGNKAPESMSGVGFAVASNNFVVGGNIAFGSGSSSDTKVEDCVAALFLTNPRDDREQFLSSREKITPGTCKWISNNDQFNLWRDTMDRERQLLWLSGGPGLGKTMLSIFLTQELERSFLRAKSVIVLYFFCDGQDEKRNTAVCILRGLIYQLIEQRPSLRKILVQEYMVQRGNLFKSHSFEPLWRIFEGMIQESTSDQIYCILDGLDECQATSLGFLLRKLRSFFSSNEQTSAGPSIFGLVVDEQGSSQPAKAKPSVQFRLLLVSREEPECLPQELDMFQHIKLAANSGYQIDRQTIIKARAEEVTIASGGSKVQAPSVTQALSKGGDGSLLWVGLAAQKLKKSLGPAQLLTQKIEQLPPKLEDMYFQALTQIPDEWTPLVSAILRWIAVAFRPLKMEELEIGSAQSLGRVVQRQELLQAIRYCESILTIRDGEVVLAHQTVKDLLVGSKTALLANSKLQHFQVHEKDAHSELAMCCVSYLEGGPLKWGSTRVTNSSGAKISYGEQRVLQKFPFLPYAVMNWAAHASHGLLERMNFSSPFFQKSSVARRSWWESYWISSRSTRAWGWTCPKHFTLLHIAAWFGIVPLAQYLKREGLLEAQMAGCDTYVKNPHEYCIERVQTSFLEYLIENGLFEQNIKWSADSPLIHQAAKSGDPKMVQLLLGRGSKVDDLHVYHKWSVKLGFQAAAATVLLMPRIVTETADKFETGDRHRMWRKYGSNETALHLAAAYGHDAVAEVLLNSGSDANAQTTGGWTPLHNAAWYGKASLIRILVSFGAKVDIANTEDGWMPLHCAANESHTTSVQALLDAKSPVDALTRKNKGALHLAAYAGAAEIVELLLQNGANINLVSLSGGTPLIYASRGPRENVLLCLLEHGAKTDIVDNGGKTAFNMAGEAVVRKWLQGRQGQTGTASNAHNTTPSLDAQPVASQQSLQASVMEEDTHDLGAKPSSQPCRTSATPSSPITTLGAESEENNISVRGARGEDISCGAADEALDTIIVQQRERRPYGMPLPSDVNAQTTIKDVPLDVEIWPEVRPFLPRRHPSSKSETKPTKEVADVKTEVAQAPLKWKPPLPLRKPFTAADIIPKHDEDRGHDKAEILEPLDEPEETRTSGLQQPTTASAQPFTPRINSPGDKSHPSLLEVQSPDTIPETPLQEDAFVQVQPQQLPDSPAPQSPLSISQAQLSQSPRLSFNSQESRGVLHPQHQSTYPPSPFPQLAQQTTNEQMLHPNSHSLPNIQHYVPSEFETQSRPVHTPPPPETSTLSVGHRYASPQPQLLYLVPQSSNYPAAHYRVLNQPPSPHLSAQMMASPYQLVAPPPPSQVQASPSMNIPLPESAAFAAPERQTSSESQQQVLQPPLTTSSLYQPIAVSQSPVPMSPPPPSPPAYSHPAVPLYQYHQPTPNPHHLQAPPSPYLVAALPAISNSYQPAYSPQVPPATSSQYAAVTDVAVPTFQPAPTYPSWSPSPSVSFGSGLVPSPYLDPSFIVPPYQTLPSYGSTPGMHETPSAPPSPHLIPSHSPVQHQAHRSSCTGPQ